MLYGTVRLVCLNLTNSVKAPRPSLPPLPIPKPSPWRAAETLSPQSRSTIFMTRCRISPPRAARFWSFWKERSSPQLKYSSNGEVDFLSCRNSTQHLKNDSKNKDRGYTGARLPRPKSFGADDQCRRGCGKDQFLSWHEGRAY